MNPWSKNPAASVQSLSPRVRRGLALYASAAVRTKREASMAVGLHPSYITMLTNSNPLAMNELRRLMDSTDEANFDMVKLLNRLSLHALEVIAGTMTQGSSEALRLKAAQDLADRGPQTSKVQRHQVESWQIDPADAKRIAAAMVESAQIRQAHEAVLVGSHDATGVSTPDE